MGNPLWEVTQISAAADIELSCQMIYCINLTANSSLCFDPTWTRLQLLGGAGGAHGCVNMGTFNIL